MKNNKTAQQPNAWSNFCREAHTIPSTPLQFYINISNTIITRYKYITRGREVRKMLYVFWRESAGTIGIIKTNAPSSCQPTDRHTGGSVPLWICFPGSHRNALVAPSIVPLPWNKFRGRSFIRWRRPPYICSTRDDGPMMESERSSTSRVAAPKSPFSVPKATSSNTTTITATKAPSIADLLMEYAIGMKPRSAASWARRCDPKQP